MRIVIDTDSKMLDKIGECQRITQEVEGGAAPRPREIIEEALEFYLKHLKGEDK